MGKVHIDIEEAGGKHAKERVWTEFSGDGAASTAHLSVAAAASASSRRGRVGMGIYLYTQPPQHRWRGGRASTEYPIASRRGLFKLNLKPSIYAGGLPTTGDEGPRKYVIPSG